MGRSSEISDRDFLKIVDGPPVRSQADVVRITGLNPSTVSRRWKQLDEMRRRIAAEDEAKRVRRQLHEDGVLDEEELEEGDLDDDYDDEVEVEGDDEDDVSIWDTKKAAEIGYRRVLKVLRNPKTPPHVKPRYETLAMQREKWAMECSCMDARAMEVRRFYAEVIAFLESLDESIGPSLRTRFTDWLNSNDAQSGPPQGDMAPLA